MKSSFSRVLSLAMGAAVAVGTMLAAVPANAAPGDVEPAAAAVGGDNLIPDTDLRACVDVTMQALGVSPAQSDSITRQDLDALAAASSDNYWLTCQGVASLEGLQNLIDPQFAYIQLTYSSVSDLTPLAGLVSLRSVYFYNAPISDLTPLKNLTNLTSVSVRSGRVSDLAPLQGLTNLTYLDLDGNQITSLAPVQSLTKLTWLVLANNKITDLSPLAGLTKLTGLFLNNNQITSIAPIVTFINATMGPCYFDASQTCGNNRWTLANNQITDLSSVNWSQVNLVWNTVPSEYQTGVHNYAVTDQSVTQTGIVGTTVPLPQVRQAAGDPNPISWTVKSGNATINADDTITYNVVGPLQLTWADSMTINGVNLSFFSGNVSVNVSAAGIEETPSAIESEVQNPGIQANTTGGAARLADGTDSYSLTVTVWNENHTAELTGYSRALSVSSSPQVTLGSFTDNGNGTYSLPVSSATPGIYAITVTLNGQPVGTIPVNFIGASIEEPTRLVGQQQVASALGFLPGEQVHATLHSDPIDLGSGIAGNDGTATVTFTIPKDFALGRHTVEFVGATSGTVTVAFDVVELKADTGGSARTTGTTAAALVFALCVASAFALVMGSRRRTN